MRATRTITFTCEWCYRQVTEERAPGPTPAYCSGCRDEARRAGARQRVKEHRERLALINPPKRGPGRPRGT